MTPDALFQIANPLALLGWIILALAPLSPRWSDLIAGWTIPALLSGGYSVIMLVHFAGAEGGFQTLDGVMLLFTQDFLALAGWVHFLAFDLFIGGWILRDARARGYAHWTVLPILPFVFMLGPLGFVIYLAMRVLRGPQSNEHFEGGAL